MDYIKVTVFTTEPAASELAAVLADVCGGCQVDDPSELRDLIAGLSARWDYIDEDLLRAPEAPPSVSFYASADADGEAIVAEALELVKRIKAGDETGFYGSLEHIRADVKSESWADNWKAYFKPIPIGERLFIRPSWEPETDAGDRAVLVIDPGMAFGTGKHSTTEMCLEALEREVTPGVRIFDAGCGSGILACAALLLGAGDAVLCDIDEEAVRSAGENLAMNGVGEKATCLAGDMTAPGEPGDTIAAMGPYSLIAANITADVLMLLRDKLVAELAVGGKIIMSGIIDERAHEVEASYALPCLKINEKMSRKGWTMYVMEKISV